MRVLPSIRVERVSGGYRITLQDHASHQQISGTCQTLAGLPRALEAAMVAAEPQWREYKSQLVKDPAKRLKRKNA